MWTQKVKKAFLLNPVGMEVYVLDLKRFPSC